MKTNIPHNITAVALLALMASLPRTASAQTSASDTTVPTNGVWNYTARLGLNIGGTAPVGMPATIRRMNEYKLQPNFTLGVDAEYPIDDRWGLLTGVHIDNKGMNVDATVKNYHMVMTKGGDELEGYYTGRLVTKVEESMVTLPLQATCHIGQHWRLRLGPYISYVYSRSFKGHVYDGYLRYMTPTSEKIMIGHDEDSRGTYDFSDNMRRFQLGIGAGADWTFSHRWGAYADLQWGVTGVHESSFKTIEQTLYPIFGTLGVTYRLK